MLLQQDTGRTTAQLWQGNIHHVGVNLGSPKFWWHGRVPQIPSRNATGQREIQRSWWYPNPGQFYKV